MSDFGLEETPRRPHGHVVPRFAGLSTFARLPYTQNLQGADVAIFGVPYDGGTTFRPGARFGPQGIRQASRLLRAYNYALDVQPFDDLSAVDYGDLALIPFDIEETYTMVEEQLSVLYDNDTFPVALGGDHSVGLPLLRACAKKHGPVSLVQLDSHPDTWEQVFGKEYSHATVMKRAIDEGLINPHRSVQVGIRGTFPNRDDLEKARATGLTVVTVEELFRRGIQDVAAGILDLVGDKVYLSFDIDFVDPAYAPGTGTPEIGGPTSRQALDLLRELKSLPLVGFDLVEVSPPYDSAEITSMLAANVVQEVISLLAWQKLHHASTNKRAPG
ncbi:MAG: agmatinase [Chloroflexota bacterium]|jgi:agmatinase